MEAGSCPLSEFRVQLPKHQTGIQNACRGGRCQDHGDDVKNRGWRRYRGGAEDSDQGVPRVVCRSEAGLGKRRNSGCEAASASLTSSTIRKITMSVERALESVRSTLLSFSNGDRQQYAPQSGEIIGILKRLKDEMSAHLSAAQKG